MAASPSSVAPLAAAGAADDDEKADGDGEASDIVATVEARSLATTTVRTFPNWVPGQHWTEDPRVMPTYEARTEAQALLRRAARPKSGEPNLVGLG